MLAGASIGFSPRRLHCFLAGEYESMTFDVVDRLFCKMGNPHAIWHSTRGLRKAYWSNVIWEADMYAPITEESRRQSLEMRRERARLVSARRYARDPVGENARKRRLARVPCACGGTKSSKNAAMCLSCSREARKAAA